MFVVLLAFMCFEFIGVQSSPVDNNYLNHIPQYAIINGQQVVQVDRPILGQRGIWDTLGNWIQSSDWFPIQINIPQTFGSIGNGIQSFASNIVQRIPFLNRPLGHNNPRPYKEPFPVKQRIFLANKNFNPFPSGVDENLPYP